MRQYCFLLASVAFFATPAQAQDNAPVVYAEPAPDRPITVTATGLELAVEDSGQPITIIDREELDLIQGPDLARVLTRAPGVSITRNGAPGGFTGVRVRGAGAEQLLVLIDGVRVNDVAAPGGGFDFGNLLAGEIERIELLRGPNSVAWGSDAIAGVMNIVTRIPHGLRAAAEYGSNDSRYATLGAGIVTGAMEAGLTGSYFDTDGFSSAASGTEDDGFEQWQLTGRARYALGPAIALTANGRYAEGTLEQDGYPAPLYTLADTLDFQDTREVSGRVGAQIDSGALFLDAGYALADTQRLYTGESYGDFPYETQGRSERAELFGRYDLAGPLAVDFGADREWTSFDDSGSGRDATITSAHVLPGFYGDALTLAAGVRYDDHSRFGDAWTFGANGALRLAGDLRLRASYGEGFKAPTLFQSASAFYGNPGLSPERSKGYDIGLEKGSRNGAFHAGVSLFRRDSRNLIDFVSCFGVADPICAGKPFGTYDNVGRARSEGVEIELGARIAHRLRGLAVFTHVESTDRTADGRNQGNALARRPEDAATVSLDWLSPWGPSLGGDIRLVGDSFDDPGNFTRLDGYATADIRAALPLGERIELYGRVENLFDADYQTVAGFGTAGRSAYIGARLRL